MSNLTAPPSLRPRITVASVVERDGRFLLVEEYAENGDLVINQPAGHVEYGETLPAAAVRETLEETGWEFTPEAVVGVYLWNHPNGQISYLRVCLSGTVGQHHAERPLDEGIVGAVWLTRAELQARRLRSPLVVAVIDDYLTGERYPLSLLKSLLGKTLP